MHAIDYKKAQQLLDTEFPEAEEKLLINEVPTVDNKTSKAFDTIFQSRTQAYREVLLGYIIAKSQNVNIDITLPYVKQGQNSFNGRSLDEKVVNPFLQEKQIPCSKGPYLSVFRRDAKFDEDFKNRVRDQVGYESFLFLIKKINSFRERGDILQLLLYLLFNLAKLRQDSIVAVSRLKRISLEQFDQLISGLLSTRSGGLFPVALVVATFQAIINYFKLDWTITTQGINVADKASGATGDISIYTGDKIIVSAEITERNVDKNRVISTFNTKIAPVGLEEYLFFVKEVKIDSEVQAQTQHYFTQGHEVNFVEIKNWILMVLTTIGKYGREIFNNVLLEYISTRETHKALKVAWNEQIAKISKSVQN
jgi:hypothetical protein